MADTRLLLQFCKEQLQESLDAPPASLLSKKLKRLLATLKLISAQGDAAIKSELAHLGLFELFANLLVAVDKAPIEPADSAVEGESTGQGARELAEATRAKKLFLKNHIQALIAACCWSLCIAHTPNKQKAKAILTPVLSLLEHSTHADVLFYAASAIWSACYGIPENQSQVLAEGGIIHIVRHLLESPSTELRHALTGALWHISALPASRIPIIEAGAIEPLVVTLETRGRPPPATGEGTSGPQPQPQQPQQQQAAHQEEEEEDEERRDERLIITAVTLANLSMAFSTRKELPVRMKDGFARVSEFVRSMDYTRFTLHNLVWTTLKPLCDLLEAPHWEVNELGSFLVACLSRTNQQTAKLFLEGAVPMLQRLAVRRRLQQSQREEEEGGDESDEVLGYTRGLARFVLSNIGEKVVEEKAEEGDREKGKEKEKDGGESMEEVMKLLGLEQWVSLFQKQQIDLQSLQLLKETDLVALGIQEMGPRKKILNYGRSLRRSEKPHKMMKKRNKKKEGKEEEGNNHCLVCYDAEKTACFVPCGHVLTCEMCAKILVARGDPCPICRMGIERVVTPFYL